MPGPPIVYYGSERELSQRQSIHANDALGFDEARMPMDWREIGEHTSAKVMREMAAFRRENPWLSHARWQTLELEPQKVVFNVSEGENHLLVKISRDQEDWQVTFR